ncbi:hypothetical protein SprV_0702308300 [Sparganum proliferum]
MWSGAQACGARLRRSLAPCQRLAFFTLSLQRGHEEEEEEEGRMSGGDCGGGGGFGGGGGCGGGDDGGGRGVGGGGDTDMFSSGRRLSTDCAPCPDIPTPVRPTYTSEVMMCPCHLNYGSAACLSRLPLHLSQINAK